MANLWLVVDVQVVVQRCGKGFERNKLHGPRESLVVSRLEANVEARALLSVADIYSVDCVRVVGGTRGPEENLALDNKLTAGSVRSVFRRHGCIQRE